MNGFLRLSFCSVLGFSILAGSSYLCPKELANLGLDFQGLAALQCQSENNEQLAGSLDQQIAEGVQRLLGKQQVIDELLSGRLTFLQAAARFRDLNQTIPRTQWALRLWVASAGSDNECHCRQVISYVKRGLSGHVARGALASRCEAELTDHLQRHTLCLPE